MYGKPDLNSSLGFAEGFVDGIWNTHPVKLKFLNKYREQIPNPNPKGKKKTVWGAKCDLCKEYHVISNIQVDHIDGGDYTLKSLDDVQSFFENVILVTESDLRLLCKECNSTCTYAKRYNLSYEEAFCTKYVIKLLHEKRIKDFFTTREIPIPRNQALQRSEAIKILLKEIKNV